jgi:hypothetical protein
MKRSVVALCALVVFFGATVRAGAGQIATRAQLNAILGGNQILENFETLNVPQGGQRNSSSPLDSTTLFDGSGPGLVQPGARYSSGGANPLFWNGNGYFNLNTQTLGDSSDWRGWGMSITYTTLVDAFGFDMQGYQGFPMTGMVSVYDQANVLLSSTAVNGGFFGWENAAGIGRVVIAADTGYIMIDNHGYGRAVPEPAGAVAFFMIAALVVGFARKWRPQPATFCVATSASRMPTATCGRMPRLM